MRDLTDLSPGTQLRTVNGATVRVQAQDGERVILATPQGSVTVSRNDLMHDIAAGAVEVRN